MEGKRLGQIKRAFYMVVLGAGTAASLLDWLIGLWAGQEPFDQVAAPAGAAISFGLFVLLWRRKEAVRFVEMTGFTLMAGILLIKLFFILHRAEGINVAAELASFGPWFAVIYIGPFLVFPPRRALLVAFSAFFIALGIGLAHILPALAAGIYLPELSPLVHLYLSKLALIGFFAAYANLKDEYRRTRNVARHMRVVANTDFLLGVHNRRYLQMVLSSKVEEARRYGRPFSVIMFDMDHFKSVNDTYGHLTGDRVLKEVARQIQHHLRKSDLLGRWGGEEFLILCPETDSERAHQLARRLHEVVRQVWVEPVGAVTASFGVATFRQGDSFDSLIRRADQGLYTAKALGRNRVVAAD